MKKKHDWAAMCEALQIRSGGRCEICQHFIGILQPANAHHILPRSRGGSDKPENLLAVCSWPNVPYEKFGVGYPGCHNKIHANPKESKKEGHLK